MTKRTLMVAALLMVFVGSASANSTDPQIIIRNINSGGSIQLNSLDFVFDPFAESISTKDAWPDCVAKTFVDPSNPTGPRLNGFTCEVRNVTGFDLFDMLFTWGGSQGPLTTGNGNCGDIFAQCSDPLGGNTSVFLSGGVIPNGSHFLLDFVGYGTTTVFRAQSNVPEPGTLGMAFAGIAALLGLRRRNRKV